MRLLLHCTAAEMFVFQALPFLLMVMAAVFLWEILLIVAGIVWATVQFSWMIGVSRAANSYLARPLHRSTRVMEIALCYAFLYIPIGSYVLLRGPETLLIVVLHLAAMAAIFYALWFSARQLSTVRHRSYSFENTFRSFLLMWFFPIGIWFLQPFVRQRLGREGAYHL